MNRITNAEAMDIIGQFKISLDTLSESLLIEACDFALDAMRMREPMPVRITTSTKRCWNCNRQLSGKGNIHTTRNFCPACGQAIKWD